MLEATAYTTGPLNQYTAIERGEEATLSRFTTRTAIRH